MNVTKVAVGIAQPICIVIGAILLGDTVAHQIGIGLIGYALMPWVK